MVDVSYVTVQTTGGGFNQKDMMYLAFPYVRLSRYVLVTKRLFFCKTYDFGTFLQDIFI